MDANRKTAYYTLMDVETKNSYSNLALNHHIIVGKPDSTAFVRELVYGVLENKIYLDYIIEKFVDQPMSKLKVNDLIVLRMGIYQIAFMDSVPPYAAVSESVDMAKKFCKGRQGFINGVLRNYMRNVRDIQLPNREEDEVAYLSIKYSYEPWIVELWLDAYETKFVEELLEAGNKRPALCIRINHLKTTKNDLMERLIDRGFKVEDGNLSQSSLRVKGSGLVESRLYKNGLFSIQDEGSMITTEILGPEPGETIIDVCAAPGGKTLYMAELMQNKGTIHAWDVYKRKLTQLENGAKRIGASIIKTRPWDGTKVDSAFVEKADRVLVDVPCSGLGVVRRKPEIKYKKLTNDTINLPRKQLDILSSSSKYVKSGGVLVYSTCTIREEENQRVIFEFLKKNPNFTKEESVQLLPNINDTDGFFICRLRRK